MFELIASAELAADCKESSKQRHETSEVFIGCQSCCEHTQLNSKIGKFWFLEREKSIALLNKFIKPELINESSWIGWLGLVQIAPDKAGYPLANAIQRGFHCGNQPAQTGFCHFNETSNERNGDLNEQHQTAECKVENEDRTKILESQTRETGAFTNELLHRVDESNQVLGEDRRTIV